MFSIQYALFITITSVRFLQVLHITENNIVAIICAVAVILEICSAIIVYYQLVFITTTMIIIYVGAIAVLYLFAVYFTGVKKKWNQLIEGSKSFLKLCRKIWIILTFKIIIVLGLIIIFICISLLVIHSLHWINLEELYIMNLFENPSKKSGIGGGISSNTAGELANWLWCKMRAEIIFTGTILLIALIAVFLITNSNKK